MNLEIANRLVEYRKKHNLSQEDVAEKIGVSRQAVSKWERVEASPDTDNLIALASLYNVSLDELILGKKPKQTAETDPDAVVVERGGKRVVVNGGHVYVNDVTSEEDDEKHGLSAKAEVEFSLEPSVSSVHRFFQKFPFPVLTLIAYLLFGFFHVCGGWAYGWLVFLLIPIYYSLVDSFFLKKADSFAFPVAVSLLYLWLGFEYGLWHPAWILFLTIPFYYFICEFISKLLKKTKKK